MRCAKLFLGRRDTPLCNACMAEDAEREAPPPMDDDAPLPLAVRRLAQLMALYDAQSEGVHAGLIAMEDEVVHPAIVEDTPFDATGSCVLCGRPRLKNSDYCLDCQTRLHKEISEAARDLTLRPAPRREVPSVRAIISDLASAHPRPSHVRNNPYPMGRIRPE